MSAIAGVQRVTVLLGGRSAEREVSLHTGEQVVEALKVGGFDVAAVDPAESSFIDQIRESRPDVVFIALHGTYGEDGTIQGLLELLDLPYVGSGVLASALAMSKLQSKRLYTLAGLKTPAYMVVRRGENSDPEAITAALGSKTVVKPGSEGSSVGMSIVSDPGGLPAALDLALTYDPVALVERFEPGVEVTVSVLGNDDPFALPTLEVVPENEFYDYESKYTPGMSRHVIPARVSGEARAECQRLAVEAHKLLGCAGMSRSDTIVTPDGEVFLLETNTIPGMTKTSLLPDAARAAGIEFPELCARLIGLAMERAADR